MSKSILVIDTPEHCRDCPLLNEADECMVQDKDANLNAGDSWDKLIKGCPLNPLPEKRGSHNTEYDDGYIDGCFEGEREYDVMNALADYEDAEEWIIAISNSIVNGIRFMRVSGTVDQIKQILIDLVYNDVTEDEKEFYSGTYDISKIEEEIHNGELYALNAYNTFSYYQIDYSAQRLSKMQCHKF